MVDTRSGRTCRHGTVIGFGQGVAGEMYVLVGDRAGPTGTTGRFTGACARAADSSGTTGSVPASTDRLVATDSG